MAQRRERPAVRCFELVVTYEIVNEIFTENAFIQSCLISNFFVCECNYILGGNPDSSFVQQPWKGNETMNKDAVWQWQDFLRKWQKNAERIQASFHSLSPSPLPPVPFQRKPGHLVQKPFKATKRCWVGGVAGYRCTENGINELQVQIPVENHLPPPTPHRPPPHTHTRTHPTTLPSLMAVDSVPSTPHTLQECGNCATNRTGRYQALEQFSTNVTTIWS